MSPHRRGFDTKSLKFSLFLKTLAFLCHVGVSTTCVQLTSIFLAMKNFLGKVVGVSLKKVPVYPNLVQIVSNLNIKLIIWFTKRVLSVT